MGKQVFDTRTEAQQAFDEVAEELRKYQKVARVMEQNFHDIIITAHDEKSLTFREIGEVLGMAHSWVYKLYWKRKSEIEEQRQKDEDRWQ